MDINETKNFFIVMTVICIIMTTITFYNFSKNKNLSRYYKHNTYYKHNIYDNYDDYDDYNKYDTYDNLDNLDNLDDNYDTYSDDIYESLIKNKFY